MSYGRIYWAGKFEGAPEPEVPHVSEENPNFRFGRALIDDMSNRLKANALFLNDGRTIMEMPSMVPPRQVAHIINGIWYVKDIYEVCFILWPLEKAVSECQKIARARIDAYLKNVIT